MKRYSGDFLSITLRPIGALSSSAAKYRHPPPLSLSLPSIHLFHYSSMRNSAKLGYRDAKSGAVSSLGHDRINSADSSDRSSGSNPRQPQQSEVRQEKQKMLLMNFGVTPSG